MTTARRATVALLVSLALIGLSGGAEGLPAVSKESTSLEEEAGDPKKDMVPPRVFPEDRALPFTPGKLPSKLDPSAASSEATDMMKDAPGNPHVNDTDVVHHPNVRDPSHRAGARL